MNDLKTRVLLWLDEKLIPEWDRAWKLLSVQGMAIMGILAGVWVALAEEDRNSIAAMVGVSPGVLVIIGLVVNVYLRLKPQDKKGPE